MQKNTQNEASDHLLYSRFSEAFFGDFMETHRESR